ncbi:MAG: type II secretion system minor pseudopilin GspK [Burkholderiaceae bacterium]
MTILSRPPRARRRLGRARQRGAAILIAMLIMTLVATLAAGMVWLQWRGIEVESAERARGQGEWLLNGALDWGNLILKSSIRNGHVEDDLTQPWATPLAETKLSSFLSADGSRTDGSGPDAFLSGQITDMQSRYNLYNLVVQTDPAQARNEIIRLQQLCGAIGVSSDIATAIASGLAQSYAAETAAAVDPGQKDATSAVLMPRQIDDLAWYGIDPKVIRQIEPFVAIIPPPTAATTLVNANTASAEVLMAAMPAIGRAAADQIIQRRQQKPFQTVAEVTAIAGSGNPGAAGAAAPPPPIVDVKSSYFEIYGQLRYEQHVIRERSIVYRVNPILVRVLRRERLPPDVP